jgi:hypothetical protein
MTAAHTKAANEKATKAAAAGNTKGTNKEVIQSAAPKAGAEVISAAPTKTSIANPILAEMFAKPEAERPRRKDMIKTIMEKADLTEKAAATYVQNFKAKNGLTKPRVVEAAPATA